MHDFTVAPHVMVLQRVAMFDVSLDPIVSPAITIDPWFDVQITSVMWYQDGFLQCGGRLTDQSATNECLYFDINRYCDSSQCHFIQRFFYFIHFEGMTTHGHSLL